MSLHFLDFKDKFISRIKKFCSSFYYGFYHGVGVQTFLFMEGNSINLQHFSHYWLIGNELAFSQEHLVYKVCTCSYFHGAADVLPPFPVAVVSHCRG